MKENEIKIESFGETGKYEMGDGTNDILLVNQTNETYTEFKQTEDKITFSINGEIIVEIRSGGDCFKNSELITNDIEVFNSMKAFAKLMCNNNK